MTEAIELPRQFASLYGSQDTIGLAGLFAPDATFQSLTGRFLEGRDQIAKGLEEEFLGVSRMARLVSGKASQRMLGPGAAILHQRLVVTGLRDANGSELPRIGAMLTAVVAAQADGWQILSATFAILDP